MADFLDVITTYNIPAAYWVNLKLAFFSTVIALTLGLVLAMMRISPIPSLRALGASYVTLMRNTPLTVIMVFAVLVLWPIFGVNFSQNFAQNFFWLAVLSLSVYHASFFCEAIRSGVNTVPVGQAEAARAIGLSFLPAARLVIMPQAFRGAIAPLGNTIIALIKNTTVAAAASVAEISILMREMIENNGNYVIPIFLTIAVGFVVIVIPVGMATTYLSQKLAVSR
ncbi:amino acid ABC transporter permease [Jonesia denitrificans]|uniref:Polar amino acid ABC transporter, inner membrane subunit n=1 Tax=Jonesia denitrificans (strain ATCC 14870 / DSM 20603 / BCRC 15368 / CIP 55.134 / JCM 11481 / NBRC 15587 / NCTC 10816 / Prevot 55134) TaxID=471856 RepID=C7R5G7_JONDD|nr:ABC transporter permease subunit [Jonesia denitrificans]ACV09240.1 polar amino acid ABC transporter, inner membrane subunit [Jonesia denitrificans DSM 20603]ASE09490.1 ABC transporter permease [Jonesia denitrificans]QXB44036.1 ABC transporter permease subunit [Jonesia denitrificans]SQH21475.1 L-cystine transport system permease protein tcyB [Jonesia denitrificans]